MPDEPQPSSVADIANSLSVRKENSYPTVLLLGSRAGGLFRSQAFLDTVQRFPEYLSATPPVQQDRFTLSYQFLNRAPWGAEEHDGHLVGFLNTIVPTEADMSLVGLIKEHLFNVIVTTNIDRLLEQALENAGLRERFDFDVFLPDRSQDFRLGGRQVYSRIIKSFGSLAARSYQIVKRNAYLDYHLPLKALLEETLSKDILVVGLDPAWDEELLRAFLPNTDNSLWFVQEEMLLDHPQVSRIFHGRPVKYIAGQEGSYETFFTTLYRRLMQKPSAPVGNISVVAEEQPLLLSAPTTESGLLSQEYFVNRAPELQIIDEAFATLADQGLAVRTPILAFHGIGGIGKTAMLQQVMVRCNMEKLPYIHTEAQDIRGFSRAILEQVSQYHDVMTLLENDNDWLDRSVIATSALLKQGPAVMLIDSLDPTNIEQVKWLEELLGKVLLTNNFFVVLTSKRQVLFRRERLVARRLRSVELKPLDRDSCRAYLSRPNVQLEAEVRDLIYEWTQGYPLAMQVMKDSIATGLDPRKAEDRLLILQELLTQVIDQKMLARVDQARLSGYRTILPLLSVPRSSSFEMIRTLIGRFAPEFRREGELAYLSLPHEINEVLAWNRLSKGYSIDGSVRNIFLLDLKIRQPDLYRSIHDFLANFNQERMMQASGLDRARYLCEYLYHLACTGDDSALPGRIQQAIQQMNDQSPETFLQFSEEFMQDEELQETLGIYQNATLSLVHQILTEIYRRLARETSGADRIRFLSEFFSHLMQDQETTHVRQRLREQITQIIHEEKQEIVAGLFAELEHNERFRSLLDADYERFVAQVQALKQDLPPEG